MNIKHIIVTILVIFLISLEYVQAQNTTEYSDYRRSLKKNNTDAVESPGGLLSTNSACLIGREPGPIKYRAVYQFDLTESLIPDGSQITKAVFTAGCTKNTATNELYAYFYNITYDMIGTDNYDEIFAQMDVANSTIGQAQSNNNQIILNSNDPVNTFPEFKQAIQNSLVNNKFVLGIRWAYDGQTQSKTWYLDNWSMNIYIEYTPPTQMVTLDQRLSNNTQVGKLRKWEGADFTPSPFINPGTPFSFPVNSIQTIQGDQTVYSNEKYQKWTRNTSDEVNVSNHHSFTITAFDNTFTSKLNPSQSGITIKNSLEGTGIDGGQIRFKDPWLLDYPDPSFPNPAGGFYKRNRGMDNDGPDKLEFKSQTSPFIPDYTSPFNGDVYKGIFLNQTIDPSNPQKSYYSVGSLSEQTISVNSQNRKFYPFKWGGTGVTIQGEYWPETGIVFNNSSAVATGILKGQLMSNSTTGISSNSQRKMVRTDNGIYHVMYESMGNVFYTHSLTSNFDGEWAADQFILDHAKNPAIEYDGNIVKAVCEYYDPAYSTNVDLYLLTFTQQSNGTYVNIEDEVFANCPSSYFGSAKPVISYNPAGVALVYRKNSTEGLKVKTKWLLNGTWT